jgi:hypothetical protein
VNGEDYSGEKINLGKWFSDRWKDIRHISAPARGYANYLIGRGAPLRVKASDFTWDKAGIATNVAKLYQGKPGAYTFGQSDSLKCYNTANVPTSPKDAAGKALIGTGTAFLTGKLTVSEKTWRFEGSAQFLDYYDFDTRVGTSGSRGFVGESSTVIGAGGGFVGGLLTPVITPTNFVTIIEGDVSIKEEGNY